MKILVAYDGGSAARRALYKAAQLARATHAQVGVISVVPLHMERGRPIVEPWDDQASHREHLAEADAVFKASGIEPELIEATGSPAEQIEEAAEIRGYDTIVLGGHRKSWFSRLMEGDVMRDVLERVTTTVVVVP